MRGMATEQELVRQVLARELETINSYEQAARQAESELVRSFLLHLAEEEKEHVAEAMELLQRLDPAQRGHAARVDVGMAHFTENRAFRPAAVPARADGPQVYSFTVGSLRRRKDEP